MSSNGYRVFLLIVGFCSIADAHFFEKIKAQFDAGTTAPMTDFAGHQAWAGKCVSSRQPALLHGGCLHAFTEHDPILGQSTIFVPQELRTDENIYLNQKKEEVESAREVARAESELYDSAAPSNNNSLLFKKYNDYMLRNSQTTYEMRVYENANGKRYYLLHAQPNHGNSFYCYYTRLITGEGSKPPETEDQVLVPPKAPPSASPSRGGLK
jgi:hypothetical protein